VPCSTRSHLPLHVFPSCTLFFFLFFFFFLLSEKFVFLFFGLAQTQKINIINVFFFWCWVFFFLFFFFTALAEKFGFMFLLHSRLHNMLPCFFLFFFLILFSFFSLSRFLWKRKGCKEQYIKENFSILF